MKKKLSYNIFFYFIFIFLFSNFVFAGQGCILPSNIKHDMCNYSSTNDDCAGKGYYYGCGRECCNSLQICCLSGCYSKQEGCSRGCTPNCLNKECGSDGCSGECQNTCGLYYDSCTLNNLCVYQQGFISFDYKKICINTLDNQNLLKITINCSYCGNKINISANWKTQDVVIDVINPVQIIEYELQLPDFKTYKNNLEVSVKGNRNEIKDIKDEKIYSVYQTKQINLDYSLFFYCPKADEINSNFPYNNENDFKFYSNNLLYNWDECNSFINLKKCTDYKNVCVDYDNNSYNINMLADVDKDGEIEICYSRNNLNGGWLDLDVNPGNCSLMRIANIDNQDLYSVWFSCLNINECLNAIDTFKPVNGIDINGVCCGDDQLENPLRYYKFKDVYKQNVNNLDLETLNVYSCCKNDASYCVDNQGVCREIGYSYCLNNKKITCRETQFENSFYFFNKTNKIGVWEETYNEKCENVCVRCNVNKEGTSSNKVDIADLTSIQNVIDNVKKGEDESFYLNDYDINEDNHITDADYNSCLNCDLVDTCGDGIIQTNEECDIKNATPIISDLCTDVCESNSKKTLLISGCDSCSCTYNMPVCIKNSCGATCTNDSDCGIGKFCNQNTCSCELKGCPVGTSLCLDNTCSDNCNITDTGFMGCKDKNGVCEENEGCACEDCINKQDSCIVGSVCGENNLCICPEGTSLCEDKTCSSDCKLTDTGFMGCKDKNGVCEENEGCACEDCYYKKDGCLNGFVCDYLTVKCVLPCEKTEEEEITINDGVDNDCDGLIDEPQFKNGKGLYIWDSNCNYFICGYNKDLNETNISFYLETNTILSFKTLFFENKDILILNNNIINSNLNLGFDDIDCLILKTNSSIKFDVRFNNLVNLSNIYLTQRMINPISTIFNYSNPICNLGCENPNNCAKHSSFFNLLEGCSPEKCIFDCGGYWINQTSFFDILWPRNNLNDYCETCNDNMTCLNYTNEISCVFDSCFASETQLGCKWNGTTCTDAFKPCIPGTTLCSDGSCSNNCRKTDFKPQECINKNGICEKGEGCACEDCENKQGSCVNGAVCSEELCSCPVNTTLCVDNTCDLTCENHGGIKGCINQNNICELGEGCGCPDCNEQKDSCKIGLVCINKLCSKKNLTQISQCQDNDNDGFYKTNLNCLNSNDCDDNNKKINPYSIEICDNDIDENCDNIKEECKKEVVSIEVPSQVEVEVLDETKIKIKLKNNLYRDLRNLNIKIETPNKIVSNNNVYIDILKLNEEKEIILNLIIRDYKDKKAKINISITEENIEIANASINLNVLIPLFKIKPMPLSETETENRICYEFYYILNNLEDYYDIELDISDPSSIFGKSLIVDYFSNLYINEATIEPLLGNPYCFYKDKIYDVKGYLYNSKSFKLTNKIEESSYELIT
ncbi:MAG: hypothetical protein QXM96_01190 [Candidatus Woesearchaeota archaeon]